MPEKLIPEKGSGSPSDSMSVDRVLSLASGCSGLLVKSNLLLRTNSLEEANTYSFILDLIYFHNITVYLI
jgi:hypothetical protein